MNFDDSYMLKLSIKISDYENSMKYYKKLKFKYDNEIGNNLSLYNTDENIYNLYKNNNNILNSDFILNLMKNPFNNFLIIKEFLDTNLNANLNVRNKNKLNVNQFFDDDKSIILYLLRSPNTSTNNLKKLKTFDYLLNNENFDFNIRNSNCLTNSQILISENPTDIDSVFLEKIEKLLKYKTEKNKFLFYRQYKSNSQKETNSDNIETKIKNFIVEPEESYKVNFADIELNLLKLNLKFRRMYEFDTHRLTDFNSSSSLTKLHLSIMDNFIFEKLLLEKI